MKTLLITFYTSIIFIFYSSELRSQILSIELNNSCSFTNNGSIEISLDSAFLSSYSLPFTLDWENMSNGEYSENIIIDKYSFDIQNLHAGDYEFIIYLGSGCQINIDTTIEENETNTLLLYPRLYHPTCGKNDGLM